MSKALNRSSIRCKALNTATIGQTKNMNIPGAIITLPTLTESVFSLRSLLNTQDIRDITEFPKHYRVDCIAASFIRRGSDIDTIRRVLGPDLQYIQIIAKIENQEGLQNYAEILEKVDGIMVARGDLGMEMAPEKVFLAQKYMLHEAALRGRFTITATQMLDSMIKKPRPTRAECTDVANSILDGSDAVMLSGESANGLYPIAAVTMLRRLSEETEKIYPAARVVRVGDG